MKPLGWTDQPSIPRCVAALLEALRFSGGPARDWAVFTGAEWQKALYYFDRNQLTLRLRTIGGLPEPVRRRLDSNYSANAERIRRVNQAFREAADALEAAGVEFAVLKGFAHWEQFWLDAGARLQYDLDLFCPAEAPRAREALIERLGLASLAPAEPFPTDHLPALVRRTGWQWRGDFFDPEIPVSIELHFRLWDEATEGFPAPGVDEFPARIVRRRLGDRAFLALDPADALGYAALHLLRHLLRGDLRAANLYELAYFLHRGAGDDAFWDRWQALHGPELRRLQAICFRLAAAWFDCALSPAAQAEIDLLPASIHRWFEGCAASPAEVFFRPNKDELWLHLCLLDSFARKSAVLRRRLFPARLPGPLDSVFLPEERLTPRVRWRKRRQYARYVAGRALFHARALLPTLSRMLMTRS